jgi:predicted Rossmann fold nucleotide-binding protein DprA/Smf involved in DNA uptake
MKPQPVTPPAALFERLNTEVPIQLTGVGNAALVDAPLLGLIASRECPGHVLLETLERVPLWVQAGRVIVSGFHSPLEQQVLRSVLRRKGQVVKVLARGIQDYRPEPDEREPLAAGQMLVITACPPTVTRTTRAAALARNRLVLALASECVVPHVATGSPLESLLAERGQHDGI